jgi:hypothetical protein
MNETLNIHELEVLTGLGERRIRQLTEAKKIPRPNSDGNWPATKTIQALFIYYRNQRQPDAVAAARLVKLEEEAKYTKLRRERAEGTLIPISEVSRVWSEIAVRLRDQIVNLDVPIQTKEQMRRSLEIKREWYTK